MSVRRCLACLTVLLIIAGCEAWSGGGGGSGTENADSLQVDVGESDAESQDYRVILTGAMSDTLTGDAVFGEVFQVATRSTKWIIELEAGSDFTGGMFITLGDTSLPAPGTYDLTVPAAGDTTAPQPPHHIVYRRGLILNIASVQGTLTFDVVSDSLIQGSFDALMRGDVPVPGAGVQKGEVRAVGRFAARYGPVGFIIGLQ